MPSSSRSPSPPTAEASEPPSLLSLPLELQVHILTYLRAYDLSSVQQTCRYYSDPVLIHKVVEAFSQRVYPSDLTAGFDLQVQAQAPKAQLKSPPTQDDDRKMPAKSSAAATNEGSTSGNLEDASEAASEASITPVYRLEHLRHMELLVVARVLSRSEPPVGGFFVSKSWCKTALKWLDVQQEEQRLQEQQQAQSQNRHHHHKKHGGKNKALSKKKQRLRQRRLSDVSPPWPNVNSDLLCEHANLQCLESKKSARARRRRMDKQAWKILKKLYPDSTQLESSHAECLQCRLEAETVKKSQQDKAESAKLERKRPLSNPHVRQFYTRTRGFPVHCFVDHNAEESKKPAAVAVDDDAKKEASSIRLEDEDFFRLDSLGDAHLSKPNRCPLLPGLYHILPRSWCHGWRRYIRTGEGGCSSPPDASDLLCDAHRLPLLPPHLEAFLYGETEQLFVGTTTPRSDSFSSSTAEAASSVRSPETPRAVVGASASHSVPGQGPDVGSLEAMRALGLSDSQVAEQMSALRHLERQQQHSSVSVATVASTPLAMSPTPTNNEQLDRENHSVVEILTEEEFSALIQCWPNATSSVFCLRMAVDDQGVVTFSTPPCRDCDATGRQCALSVRNRARSWVKKSGEKSRAPASLEEY